MIERILFLMQQNNLTANKFTTILSLPQSAITEWKKGKAKPSVDALCKIADFFDCSVDYLLGRTDIPEVNRGEVYDEEERLIAAPKITPAEITFDDDETDIT